MTKYKQETIELNTGEKKELHFPGKATSGYQWMAKAEDDTIISIEKSYQINEKEELKAGSNAAEIFTLTALAPGKTIISFQQRRSWEKTKTPADEKVVEVVIQS